MSIHPEYANAILAGDKTVEFRKRPLAADVTHVVVYATAPVGAVVGAFSVAGQETRTPLSLWRRFANVAGISKSKFFAYYGASANGTGIRVGDVLAPAQPMCLAGDLGVARPPQSFQYLATDTAKTVLDSMTQLRAVSAA